VPLMEQYGVDVWFSGHAHAYGRGYLNGVYYSIMRGGSWLDHGEPLTTDWPHMTVGGYHDVAPDIGGGLVHEYVRVEVVGGTMTARMMAFEPDGTFREVLDTFSKETDLAGVDESEQPGTSLRASASWPNPFDTSATISFGFGGGPAARTHVVFQAFDVAGRCVRMLVDGPLPAGRQTVDWDGTGDDGVEVPAGVYFYQVEVGGEKVRGKVVVVR